ncbi:uncharacterized protein LOC114532773 [Dendronephthya gigantea]|uniref:uncharacterized protein LOC114532773 n=1 Tax=Dendronephthya gigantea TaxID=151771 RepID=UPI00106AAFD4|nr:uncharacterized protein LOC114532773 [Dendronephthya gigantea]
METRYMLGILILVIGVANGYQCNDRPRKLGCFQDSPKNRLMRNEFNVKMKDSDWLGDNWSEHLNKLLCECSDKAKKAGKQYFGLQHFYECWIGNLDHVDIEKFRLKDKSKCWSKNPNPFKCAENDQVCVGKGLTMAIYEVTHSSFIIPDTATEPTMKVMSLPAKGKRPPPKIPALPPHIGRR